MSQRFRGLVTALLCCSLLLSACIDEEMLQELESIALTEEAAADGGSAAEPTSTPRPAAPTRTPAPVGGGQADPGSQTWTVMLYQNADDEVLEEDIFIDLNEAERVGSSDRVQIVSQIDRYRGAFRGDGDWDTTRRYFVQQDDDLYRLASEPLEEGEANMADGATLADFIVWAASQYPADKYVLILSDHGMGWPGGWNDPTARGRGADDVPIARAFGDLLYLNELDRTLARAVAEAGFGQFEVIGFDACLMAHVEVFAAVQPYARYAVASQEVEPGLGWAYAAFLRQLVDNPGMDGAELSQAIVNSYIVGDQRILDEAARQDYAGRRVSAAAVAEATGASATLSAVNLAQLPDVLRALDEFALALGEADPRLVARARRFAQSFESVFGEDAPPSYIDLAHFAALSAQETGDPAVTDAARALLTALSGAIVAETSGPDRPGAYGLSIYFPNSELFRSSLAGHDSYTRVAERFAADALWDDFLVAHYTGRQLTRTVTLPTPVPEAAGVAPGAAPLSLDAIQLSSKVASADQPVVLSTTAHGEAISFIYLFVGYYDEARNALRFADQDFIEGDDTQSVDGVFYPVWNGPDIPIEFEWTPTLYAIDDGTRQVQALLNPETYGASAEDATFSTDGYYVFAGGDRRYAQLIFDGRGELRAVFGFTNPDGTGAPSEITPESGDQFILLETWYDLQTQDYATTEGETLTFGDSVWTWSPIPAPAGLYNVGFIAEDLDGNYSEAYVDVQVR